MPKCKWRKYSTKPRYWRRRLKLRLRLRLKLKHRRRHKHRYREEHKLDHTRPSLEDSPR
jgi:hypothetical protein